jgi:hypothetical protein
MKRSLALLALLLAIGSSAAQISNPGGMSAAQVQALVPQPASTVPQTEAVGGAVGAATNYMRADAKIPRITRAAMVVTDVSGNWTVTWSTALLATPAVLPVPVNTGAQPIVCNVSAASATGASGRCWLARTLPATLTLLTALISFDIFGTAPTSGTTVQVLAIPPTQ